VNIATLPRRWTPVALGGCVLWLDAFRKSSLYTDSARTTPVVNSGDPVGGWEDLSGAGNHATQTSASAKPTYNATGVNSRPCVTGDGSNDCLQLPAISLTASTVFVVFKLTTVTPNGGTYFSFFSCRTGTTLAEMLLTGVPGYTNVITFFGSRDGGGTCVGFNKTLDLSPHMVCAAYSGGTYTDVASYDDYYDRVAQTEVAKGVYGRPTTDLGGLFARISSAGAGGLPAPMSICEVAQYNRKLSAAEIAAFGAYSSSKWGTA